MKAPSSVTCTCKIGVGTWIRTKGLWLMGPPRYQTAPSRQGKGKLCVLAIRGHGTLLQEL